MIKISPAGGYVTGWSLLNDKTGRDEEIFYQGSSIKRTGIPPLFPCWGDSGTNLRKHGFARDVEWNVVRKTDNEVVMSLDSKDIKDFVSQEYPSDFLVQINANTEGNDLYYSMKVINRGKEGMAIAPAIHPYFKISHDEKIKIETEGIRGFKAVDFDWDKAPPDNDYPFSKSAKVIFPDRTIEILDISPLPAFKHMVVWSQPKNSQDFNFVCFEPITALAGAIKRRDIVLDPGTEWEMKLKFTALFR